MATPEPASKVLLVEGVDDEHVVRHLRKSLNLELTFECRDEKGIDNLLKAIPLQIKVPGRQVVGILADANTNVHSRWQAIANKLSVADVLPPDTLDGDGTIIDGMPRVGVWLMPDNNHPGDLEDFVVKLVPEDDAVWPRAVEYIDNIPISDRKFKEQKTMRAKLHAWLATQEEPRQMGAAIGRGSLVAGPSAKNFANWLEKLFSTNP